VLFLLFRIVLLTSFELVDDFDGFVERGLIRVADVIDSKLTGKSRYVRAVFLAWRKGREQRLY
jgi:hypothetical protein